MKTLTLENMQSISGAGRDESKGGIVINNYATATNTSGASSGKKGS